MPELEEDDTHDIISVSDIIEIIDSYKIIHNQIGVLDVFGSRGNVTIVSHVDNDFLHTDMAHEIVALSGTVVDSDTILDAVSMDIPSNKLYELYVIINKHITSNRNYSYGTI